MIQNSYYLMGSICLISALIVVSAKNPIHRIASLVIVFMMGAFIFMLLDFYFLGLTYIIVYVGAIAILFLFVIMMVHLPSGSEDSVDNTPYTKNQIESKETPFSSSQISVISLISSSIPKSEEHVKEDKIIKIGPSLSLYLIYNCFIEKYMGWGIVSQEFGDNQLSNILYSQIINPSTIDVSTIKIYSYFYPTWSIEYLTITDIESLALMVYVAYPTALILIGIALWTVMIGIISICTPRI